MKDKNGIELTDGDIIDIHQTVNGEHLFVIVNLEKLDVRYHHNLKIKYEYSVKDLLECNYLNGDVEWEIIGKIAEKKKIVYVDMDGVIANFIKSYRRLKPNNEFPQSTWGFFANLDTIEGGIEAVKKLMEYYDVWILTRPSYKNPLCYTEKRIWIEKYFGLEFCQKLIICPDKSLVKGHYLIDDCTTDGQIDFEGEFIQFHETHKPWDEILRYLIDYKIKGEPFKNNLTIRFEMLEDEEKREEMYVNNMRLKKEADDYDAYVKEHFGPAPETGGWYMEDDE